MPTRRIVALGGGGFSMEPENPRLDDYVLALTGKAEPRVCFLPTASGDSADYLVRFYNAFAAKARPTHLALFNRTVEDPTAFLLEQDLVYVGGGNTVNMLAVWRAHGVDRALRAAWEAGVVLCGLSAGSLCWFEAGVTDSYGRRLAPLPDGLGFLPGSHCPHYTSPERRAAYARFVNEGLPGGIAADDSCALRYEGTELVEVVASREGRQAYRVERVEAGVRQETLVARLLP